MSSFVAVPEVCILLSTLPLCAAVCCSALHYSSMSGLFPGYTQVEKFGPDEDYEAHDGEVEEEVEYVTLDLGTVQPTLVPSSSTYRLVVSPFLKLRVLVRLTCIGHVF